MSFIEARMPARIAAGFKGGPEWRTSVVEMANGHERRNREWLYARYRYSASFGAFNAEDRQALIGMFQATAGKHRAFRFRDLTDCVVAAEPLAVPVGTATKVQLARSYAFGDASSLSLIQAPVAGSVAVYKDGAPFPVVVDNATGMVAPVATWEAGDYTFACQYDRWVRFDSDWGAFTANALGVWTADIELVEVRR